MCLICNRIEMIKENKNKFFVKELETGYVVIGDHQYFYGYSLFLCKNHLSELHHLPKEKKLKFLEEMSLVTEAVQRAFNAEKMNVELLGNGDAHLHWHIFPRNSEDSPLKGPVWWVDRKEMYSEKVIPSDIELEVLKENLLTELNKLC